MGDGAVSCGRRAHRCHGEILNTRLPHRVFVGLGSNRGDRQGFLDLAVNWFIGHSRIALIARSKTIETAPWGVVDQPSFLNAVIEIRTELDPVTLLGELKTAESAIGRRTSDLRWGPREIDLDILLYDDLIMDTPDLSIPHMQMNARSFVLIPLLELAPELIDPRSGKPFSDFL